MAKSAPKVETEADDLTVEERLTQLEKAARQHGWDLDGGGGGVGDEPPAP